MVNILIKNYYINYEVNHEHNLFKHLSVMNEKYCDLKDRGIKLTKMERKYGLLMLLPDHWNPIIPNLV